MVLEVFPKENTSNIAVLQFMFRSPGGFQSIFPDTWYFRGTDLGRFVDILIFRETESFNLHHVPVDCAEICLPKNQVFLYQEMLSINKPHHSGGQLNVSTSWTFQVTRHAAITATWDLIFKDKKSKESGKISPNRFIEHLKLPVICGSVPFGDMRLWECLKPLE